MPGAASAQWPQCWDDKVTIIGIHCGLYTPDVSFGSYVHFSLQQDKRLQQQFSWLPGTALAKYTGHLRWCTSDGAVQHSTAQHNIVQHATAELSAAQQSSAQHSTVQVSNAESASITQDSTAKHSRACAAGQHPQHKAALYLC